MATTWKVERSVGPAVGLNCLSPVRSSILLRFAFACASLARKGQPPRWRQRAGAKSAALEFEVTFEVTSLGPTRKLYERSAQAPRSVVISLFGPEGLERLVDARATFAWPRFRACLKRLLRKE